MFFKNTKEESTEVKRLNLEVERLNKLMNELEDDNKREIDNLTKDQEIVLNRKESEVDVRISTSVKEKDTKIAKLELENGSYKKEVEILTKAFENLGFDVKDMKEILNKLVDGIVSKNTINVVK